MTMMMMKVINDELLIYLITILSLTYILYTLGSLSLHTSDDSEDPGAEGGDEFDEDEDDTDSEIDEDEMWSCSSCLTKNHPMTRHCTGCWCRRCEWLPPGLTRWGD